MELGSEAGCFELSEILNITRKTWCGLARSEVYVLGRKAPCSKARMDSNQHYGAGYYVQVLMKNIYVKNTVLLELQT